MLRIPKDKMRVVPAWAKVLEDAGIKTPRDVFTHPRVRVWRSVRERQNGTLDVVTADGREVRFHVKRFAPVRSSEMPAYEEAWGWAALATEKIPTLEMAAWGSLKDGQSFTITVDLGGYESGQELLRRGVAFSAVAQQTAELAAQLHGSGLHHRDLYLCHFFLRSEDLADTRLIDLGRVGRLPRVWFRQRWIVKDLAQFWYSAREFSIPEQQLLDWLARYEAARQRFPRPDTAAALLGPIRAKVESIARHDEKLRQSQPGRDVSLRRPTPGGGPA